MGYKFSPEEKEQLLTMGNLGKTIDVTPKNGEPFAAYISIDPQTNEIIALRADRVNIPKDIKGVTLSDAQYKELTPVRDKDLLRKVPIAYSFQCAQAVPRAYSRRNSMLPMPHRDS